MYIAFEMIPSLSGWSLNGCNWGTSLGINRPLFIYHGIDVIRSKGTKGEMSTKMYTVRQQMGFRDSKKSRLDQETTGISFLSVLGD